MKIAELRSDIPAARQKLIHKGKILKDEQTIAELRITEFDFIVCTTASISGNTNSTSVASSAVDLDTAWQILTDPNNAVEPESVFQWMNRVGLTEKRELMDLDETHLRELAGLLKLLKQKKFLTCLIRTADNQGNHDRLW